MNLGKVYFWLGVYIIFYFISTGAPLSKFKDIAQAPGTGVHERRVFCGCPETNNTQECLSSIGKSLPCGFAFVDIYATLLLSLFLSYKYGWDGINVFVILVLISVPVHMFFGVETKLVKLINMGFF